MAVFESISGIPTLRDFSSPGLVCIAASSSENYGALSELRLRFVVTDFTAFKEIQETKAYKGYHVISYATTYDIAGEFRLDLVLLYRVMAVDWARDTDGTMIPKAHFVEAYKPPEVLVLTPDPAMEKLRLALVQKYKGT